MNKEISEKQGMIFVFLSGVCWGIGGACGEYITKHRGFDIDILIPYRLLISGIIVLLFCIFRKIKFDFEIFKNKKHLINFLIYSIFGIFFAQYFYFYGVSLSNAAIATVIQFIAPVFIILIVCAEEKRLPKINETTAFICVFLGAFLLATNGDLSRLVISPKAFFVCILAMLGAVANATVPRKLNKIYSPLPVLGYAMTLVGLVFCLQSKIWLKSFSMDLWLGLAIFWVIIVGTVVAFGLYMIGLNKIGAAKTTVISSNVPIIAALTSHFWLGTSLFAMQIVGFMLIIFAIFLAIKK